MLEREGKEGASVALRGIFHHKALGRVHLQQLGGLQESVRDRSRQKQKRKLGKGQAAGEQQSSNVGPIASCLQCSIGKGTILAWHYTLALLEMASQNHKNKSTPLEECLKDALAPHDALAHISGSGFPFLTSSPAILIWSISTQPERKNGRSQRQGMARTRDDRDRKWQGQEMTHYRR